MTTDLLVLVAVAAGVIGLILWLVYHNRGPRPRTTAAGTADAQAEREFRAVFSMTSQAGKEALIDKWMRRKGCDRSQAMRLAVEEWRRDNR
jgi:hypothetical protein